MRIGKMHLYSRIALLVAIGSVAKCSVVLDGISHEHEAHREGKGISLEHGTHIAGKEISQEHETDREGKRIKGQRTNIQPLLDSLLGIIEFDSEDCTAGECVSQKECVNMNGTAGDRCAEGFGVCCTIGDSDTPYEGGDIDITDDGGFFFNPESEAEVRVNEGRQAEGERSYTATLLPADDVVQILFDIILFDVMGPIDGDCSNDSLVITGANPGLEIPVLCGSSSNQQLYVDIDNSDAEKKIILTLSPELYARQWNVSITFLKEADAVPRRCLQYITTTEGTVQSFNFDGNPPMALNNQIYSICFAYVVGYCDVAFSFSRLDLGNINGDCINDYLLIGDDKYCGDYASYMVKANATGPIYVNVRTDSDNEMQAEGFSAAYTMMGC